MQDLAGRGGTGKREAGERPVPEEREEGLARRLLEARKGDWELGGGAGPKSWNLDSIRYGGTLETLWGEGPIPVRCAGLCEPADAGIAQAGGWCHRSWCVCVGLVFGS